jgi:hypothetical protein
LPLDSVTFFTDRALGSVDVPTALHDFGLCVERHRDHFNSNCEDHVWIPEVGRRGWVILTKDKSFKSRQLEVAAMMKANTAAFVLTNAGTTGAQNAATFIVAMRQIFELLKRTPKPFMANVTPAGEVKLVLTHDMMIKKYLDSQ